METHRPIYRGFMVSVLSAQVLAIGCVAAPAVAAAQDLAAQSPLSISHTPLTSPATSLDYRQIAQPLPKTASGVGSAGDGALPGVSCGQPFERNVMSPMSNLSANKTKPATAALKSIGDVVPREIIIGNSEYRKYRSVLQRIQIRGAP